LIRCVASVRLKPDTTDAVAPSYMVRTLM